MTRNLIEDIIAKKKNIRQVSSAMPEKRHKLPDRRKSDIAENDLADNSNDSSFEDVYEEARSRINHEYFEHSGNTFSPRVIIWGITVFCFLILIFTIFSSLSTATVTIHPKIVSINLDDTYQLSKTPAIGELGFETIKIEKTLSKEVVATEEVRVEKKAQGKIVIYNNYSNTPQRLLKNTRFTNSDNLIFRIVDAVTIPGKKTVGGKIEPGSVEAQVIADQPGEKYNLLLNNLSGDFKIPGFMGSPRYQTFYARLKTDITGGYSGMVKKVTPEIEQQASLALEDELKKNILAEVSASKPDTHLMFQGGLFWDFASTSITSSSDNTKANLVKKVALYAVLINSQKLAKFVAQRKVDSYNGKPVDIAIDDNSLTMDINTNTLKTKPWEAESLTVHFKGTTKIAWLFDEKLVKEALVGLGKGAILNRISPVIEASKVDVSIRPAFWNNTLPNNLNKIKVVTSID